LSITWKNIELDGFGKTRTKRATKVIHEMPEE